jgi:peptidyl-prolyl cis-trans isomerase D
MTMLDRMRRHKNWLKWSLGIVVVAFIALYIPSFYDESATRAGFNDVVASVDGRDITVRQFNQAYQRQISMYRNAYGGNMDERLLRQLGIDQQVVQRLIEEEAALAEASRQGITATDSEVQARIAALPGLQENGRFIGGSRYEQLLRMQNPPIDPPAFEEQIRRGIVTEKLRGALTDWITVGEADVDVEFNRRNEKVKLAVVSFPADKFKETATATDAEITAHFDGNKEQYRVPEKRKIKYALVDMMAIRDSIKPTPQDVERYYEDNKEQYSTPDRIRASHILLKTEGKDEAAVKKQADDLLAKAKGGADFAQLADKFSEDEGNTQNNKKKGGDLGEKGRGDYVKEFEDAAFALKPGEISDVVKTQFGFHIIKLNEKLPATKQPLETVRTQIEETIKTERSQAQAQRRADDLAGKLLKPADLDTVAKARGLTVAESEFFAQADQVVSGLGRAPMVVSRAFELKPSEVSESIKTGPMGPAFITVIGTQESRLPSLDEVKARVREDVMKKKAIDVARERATALSVRFKTDFQAAARAAGLEVKTSELITRKATIPEVGQNAAVEAAAFALAVNGVSDPIITDNGAVIVKVLEKKTPTAEELKTGREGVKEQLLNVERDRFYRAYMDKARERMTITSNPKVLAQVMGS